MQFPEAINRVIGYNSVARSTRCMSVATIKFQ